MTIAQIQVAVDLSYISDSDLLGELEARRGLRRYFAEDGLRDADLGNMVEELINRLEVDPKYSQAKAIKLNWVAKLLKLLDCPTELIASFEEWARQPIATPKKLQEWNLACGIK